MRRTTFSAPPCTTGRSAAARRSSQPRPRLLQLASDQTTIVTPVRGVSELTRIGPKEVHERYGVEPAQVPDFIALRGDPSDKIPGAPGVGPRLRLRSSSSTAPSTPRSTRAAFPTSGRS